MLIFNHLATSVIILLDACVNISWGNLCVPMLEQLPMEWFGVMKIESNQPLLEHNTANNLLSLIGRKHLAYSYPRKFG